MVCTANDLQEWKDFPRGLKVLLLEGDSTCADEIRAKLGAMDYNVSVFCDENEALSAISSRSDGFHIAIVEVSISSGEGGFRFLENAKDLPTIMTSNNYCLNTMMKCIALGAVEFLSKPLSEDKLRNIWQHVVHKAFNAGSSVLSESLRPVKESVVSMLQLQTDNGQQESRYTDDDHDPGSDKYPAPSTPQLNQGARLLDDGDCQEQTNCSTEKDSGDHDGEGESKSVEITCGNLNAESKPEPMKSEKTPVKENKDFAKGAKGETCDSSICAHPCDRKVLSSTDGNTNSANKGGILSNSSAIKAHRKKMKKYRMHKRQILPKEEDRKWLNQRDQMQRNYCAQRPIMAFPPYHSNHTLSPAPLYPMWRQSGGQTAAMQVWGPPGYPLWRPPESWHWNPLPGMHADAWGCPVLPPPQAPRCVPNPQNMPGLHNTNAVDYKFSMPQSSFEHHPADEVVDKVVKEAISKPWLPLPLGLKPPSTDSVLTELSRQGISTVPPRHQGH